MSCYFYSFYLSYPFLWILSPIDVFLFFDDLGIFDYISRVCWGNIVTVPLMYSLHRWVIELTMGTAITNKQQKRNRTQTTDIHFKTSTWKSLMNPWRALSTHVKQDVLKQRSRLLPSRSICVDCLVIGRQVSQYRRPKHFLWVNKTYIWSSKTKIVKDRHSKGTESFIGETRCFPMLFNCGVPFDWNWWSRAFGSLTM